MPSRHLLIIEDSELAASALQILFEADGYRVSVAGSVAAAVATAEHDRVDVMLLDLTLPDGDGLEVLDELHRRGAPPGAAIAVTGHDDDAIRERCLAAGCRAVAVKPVPTVELRALIRSL